MRSVGARTASGQRAGAEGDLIGVLVQPAREALEGLAAGRWHLLEVVDLEEGRDPEAARAAKGSLGRAGNFHVERRGALRHEPELEAVRRAGLRMREDPGGSARVGHPGVDAGGAARLLGLRRRSEEEGGERQQQREARAPARHQLTMRSALPTRTSLWLPMR